MAFEFDRFLRNSSAKELDICTDLPSPSYIQLNIDRIPPEYNVDEMLYSWSLIISVPITIDLPLAKNTYSMLSSFLEHTDNYRDENELLETTKAFLLEFTAMKDDIFNYIREDGLPNSRLFSDNDRYSADFRFVVNWNVPQIKATLSLSGNQLVTRKQLLDAKHLGPLVQFLQSSKIIDCRQVAKYNVPQKVHQADAPQYCGKKTTRPLADYSSRNDLADVYSMASLVRVRGDGSCQFRSIVASLFYQLWRVKPNTNVEKPTFVQTSSGNIVMFVGGAKATRTDYLYLAIVVMLKWFSLLFIDNQEAAFKMLQHKDLGGSLIPRIEKFKQTIIGDGDSGFKNGTPVDETTANRFIGDFFQPYVDLDTLLLLQPDSFLGIASRPDANKRVFPEQADSLTFAEFLAIEQPSDFINRYIPNVSEWGFFGDSLQLYIISAALKRNIYLWYKGYHGRSQWCVDLVSAYDSVKPPVQYVSLQDTLSSTFSGNNLPSRVEALHVLYEPFQGGRSGHYDCLYVLTSFEIADEVAVWDTVRQRQWYPFVTSPIQSSLSSSTTSSQFKTVKTTTTTTTSSASSFLKNPLPKFVLTTTLKNLEKQPDPMDIDQQEEMEYQQFAQIQQPAKKYRKF